MALASSLTTNSYNTSEYNLWHCLTYFYFTSFDGQNMFIAAKIKLGSGHDNKMD